jgi:valyl-tRNA synthetase
MKNLDKAYLPKNVEKKWYEFWERNNLFKTNLKSSKPPYCIVMPPPNVTGSLHMGHALVNTLQDILIRYHRMMGYETLWIPGTDHAGIATQTVVEKHLIKTLGKKRKDFSREEFLSYIWQWKEEKQENILNQLQKLGCSCNWDYLRFTMDEKSNKAVKTLFKKMFNEKLIYRGDYLVNWDPATQTALADDEVEYEHRDSSLWFFKYPIKDSKEFVVIATTRPETMLGDSAIAINPKDKRYKHLKNKKVILPIINREIPIIEDHFVDPEFGSGIVKITPAHDHNDYKVGINHNLEFINIMEEDGSINENGGEFKGLKMLEAREKIVSKMKKLNFLEKIEPYKLKVGISYRSKAVIEPFLSKQWFVKMQPFKEKLINAVKNKKVKIIPKSFEETYFYWINNLRDWCISRQLWWGHQIPVWYNKKNPDIMICSDTKEIPEEILKNKNDWYRDEDVLDTWFSSALWPFSTLGWPENTKELEKFYPNAVLITGHDILFFWVARMILMGEYVVGEIPFKKTFLHGLIYSKSYWRSDKDGNIFYVPYSEKVKYDISEKIPKDVFSKWEKMSKSKGNIIDPLEIIEEYGTDAMRLALSSCVTHARQIDLDRRKFEEFKNFANKLWNAARFILQNLDKNSFTDEDFSKGIKKELFTLADKWILSLCNKTILQTNKYLKEYHFDKATIIPYKFFWDDFCSYYLEIIKPVLFGKEKTLNVKKNKQKLLLIIFIDIIRILHPLSPFITEELFSIFKNHFPKIKIDTTKDLYTQKTIKALLSPACAVASFPQVLDERDIDEKIEKEFSFFRNIIKAIRNIRAEMKIPLSQKIDVYLSFDEKKYPFIEENKYIFFALLKIENLYFKKEFPKTGAFHVIEDIKIAIPLSKTLIEKERNRLEKEKEKLFLNLESIKNRLNNKSFLEKAPKEIIEETKKTFENTSKMVEEIISKLQKLY